MFTVPVCCGLRPHCGQSWDQPGRLASKNTANNPKARRNALFMTISFFCHLSEWSAAWGKRRRGGFPLTRFGKIAGGWGERWKSVGAALRGRPGVGEEARSEISPSQGGHTGPPLRKTCHFWRSGFYGGLGGAPCALSC